MVGYTVSDRCDMGVPADDFVLNINEIINCSNYLTVR